MNFNTKSVISVFVAAMVLMAAISGGAAAAPATTSDSDITEEDLVYIDPSSDEVEELVFDFDTADPIDVTVTDVAEDDEETDTVLLELVDISDEDEDVSVDGTEYTVTIDHADLANSEERDVGETHDLEVEITDGTDTTTIPIDATIVATPDGQTMLVSDDVSDMVGLDVDEASDGTIFGIGAEDFDTYELTNNHPNGEGEGYNSTTYVFDGDTADAYDDAAEDVDDGDVIGGMTVFVQGEMVPTYAEESGDVHDDGDAYAVYNSETSELDVELGDDREDALSTDVTVVNNNVVSEVGFNDVRSMYGLGAALDFSLPFDLPF